MIIFLLMGAMEKANKDAVAFGETSSEYTFKPNSDKGNALLSEARELEEKEIPKEGTPLDNDTSEMLTGSRENVKNSDPVKEDKLVQEILARGDEIVKDPRAPIQINAINPATTEDLIYPCEESTEATPAEYFFRVLRIDYNHQPEIRMRSCTREIQYCTEGNHGIDDKDCGAKAYRTGETVNIPEYQRCSSLGWRACERDYVYVSQKETTTYTGETWLFEDPKGLAMQVHNNERSILKTQCIEGPSSKTFYTLTERRDCWKEQIFVSAPEGKKINTCLALRQEGCEKVDETCIKRAEDGSCLIYKKRYRCPTRSPASITMNGDSIHCIDGGSLVAKSPQFNDAANALTQLAGLSEMQKEIQEQNSNSPTVFKGECLSCKKNICPNLLYDCCQTKEGFAIDIGLTDCSPEEIKLTAAREKGRCQYLGAIKNKVIGLWTSSYNHYYCCFPSKLAYILQKEARKQLQKTFGTAEKPDCSALTMEELSRLDFSKMDLSELFDDIILNKANPGNLKQFTAPTTEQMKTKLESIKPPEKPL